jgi:hypothetical protein
VLAVCDHWLIYQLLADTALQVLYQQCKLSCLFFGFHFLSFLKLSFHLENLRLSLFLAFFKHTINSLFQCSLLLFPLLHVESSLYRIVFFQFSQDLVVTSEFWLQAEQTFDLILSVFVP